MTTSFAKKIQTWIIPKNTIFPRIISLSSLLKNAPREKAPNMMMTMTIQWSKQISVILLLWVSGRVCTTAMSQSILSIESLLPSVKVAMMIHTNQSCSLLAVIGSLSSKRKEKKKDKNSFCSKTFKLFLIAKTIKHLWLYRLIC